MISAKTSQSVGMVKKAQIVFQMYLVSSPKENTEMDFLGSKVKIFGKADDWWWLINPGPKGQPLAC